MSFRVVAVIFFFFAAGLFASREYFGAAEEPTLDPPPPSLARQSDQVITAGPVSGWAKDFCPRPASSLGTATVDEVTLPAKAPADGDFHRFCSPHFYSLNTALGKRVAFCHYDPATDCCVSRYVAENRYTEPDRLLAFSHFLEGRPPGIVLDVGANLGQYALFAAFLGHHVYAIEAVPPTADMIRRNALMNGVADRLTVINNGVSDAVGNLTIKLYPGNTGGAHFGKMDPHNSLKSGPTKDYVVSTVLLDDLLPLIRSRSPDMPMYAIKVWTLRYFFSRGCLIFFRSTWKGSSLGH